MARSYYGRLLISLTRGNLLFKAKQLQWMDILSLRSVPKFLHNVIRWYNRNSTTPFLLAKEKFNNLIVVYSTPIKQFPVFGSTKRNLSKGSKFIHINQIDLKRENPK